MRNLKRLCALLLSLVLTLSLMSGMAFAFENTQYLSAGVTDVGLVPGNPDSFSDIRGHWAETALRNAVTYGLMEGRSAGAMEPDGYITRAEMATLMSRALEATKASNITAFSDMSPTQWHYNYVARAVQMGLLNGSGNTMNPEGCITRQDAAVVFARAFNLYSYKTTITGYTDYTSAASYATEAIEACVGAGIMSYLGNTLGPTDYLTRGEFAQMLYGICQTYINSAVAYNGTGNISGSAMITVPGVTLQSATIGENLYLGDGVGNGTVTLNGVTVGGTVYIRGGSRLVISGGSRINNLVIYNPSYSVAVEVDTASTVTKTVVDTAVGAITLSGPVGNVVMNTSKAVLNLQGATVGTLSASVMMPTITTDKATTIDSINVTPAATGAKMNIEGTVRTVDVNASGVSLTTTKNASITNLNFVGVRSDADLGGSITKVAIGSDSTDSVINITADATIGNINLSADGDNEFNVESGAKIGSFVISEPSAKMSLVLSGDELLVDSTATKARVTLESKTNLKLLAVDADNAYILIKDGAKVDTIEVSGRDVTIEVEGRGSVDEVIGTASGLYVTGDGEVNLVTLERRAEGAKVDTPYTTVDNQSMGNATLGDTTLAPGEKGETDKTGNNPDGSSDDKKDDDKKDEDEEKPTNPDAQASKFGFSIASGADPYDIHFSGNWMFTDFGSGFTVDGVGAISGEVYQVSDFPLFAGMSVDKGYYVPVVLSTYDAQKTFTVRVGDRTWTQDDVSRGYMYRNRLVFFLPLDPYVTADMTGGKYVTVYYDADGTGTAYYEVAYRINYGSVKFVGDVDGGKRAMLLAGAPGVGDNDPVTVEDVTINSGYNTAIVSHPGLAKSDAGSGNEGYWGGLTFVGPAEATSASYVVQIGSQKTSYTTNLLTKSFAEVTESGLVQNTIYTVFNHYEDMETVKQAVFTINWLNRSGNVIGTPDVYMVDFSTVKLGAVGTVPNPGDPDDPNYSAVARSMTISEYNAYQFQIDYGVPITDLVQAYNIVDLGDDAAYYAGTYMKASFSNGHGTGYFVPIYVSIKGLQSTVNLTYGNGNVLATLSPSTGTDQAIMLIVPITAIGSQASDIKLSLIDTATKDAKSSLTKTLYGSQAAIYQSETGMMLLPVGPDFASNGLTYYNIVGQDSSYGIYAAGTTYNVAGSFNKITLPNGTPGWAVPVKVANYLEDGSNWAVKITCDGNSTMSTINGPDATTAQVLVPVAESKASGDVRYTNVLVEIVDMYGNTVKSTSILNAGAATLNGFNQGGPVVNEGQVSAEILTTIDKTNYAVNYTKFTSLVDSDWAMTKGSTNDSYNVAGKFKTSGTGSFDWGAPATVKIATPNAPGGELSLIPGRWTVTTEVADEPQTKQTFHGTADGLCHIILPLGKTAITGDVKFEEIIVTVWDNSLATAQEIGTFKVTTDGATLLGFVGDIASSKMPNASVSLASSTSFRDGDLKYTDLLSKAPSIVSGVITNQGSASEVIPVTIGGEFLQATLSDGAGWGVPLTVTLGNVESSVSSWTVRVYHKLGSNTVYKSYGPTSVSSGSSSPSVDITVPLARLTDAGEVAPYESCQVLVYTNSGTGDKLYSTINVSLGNCTYSMEDGSTANPGGSGGSSGGNNGSSEDSSQATPETGDSSSFTDTELGYDVSDLVGAGGADLILTGEITTKPTIVSGLTCSYATYTAKGDFKQITLLNSDSTQGWAIPATITMQMTPPSGYTWYVVVSSTADDAGVNYSQTYTPAVTKNSCDVAIPLAYAKAGDSTAIRYTNITATVYLKHTTNTTNIPISELTFLVGDNVTFENGTGD